MSLHVSLRVSCDYTTAGFAEAWRAWEAAVPGLRITDTYTGHADVAGALVRGDIGAAAPPPPGAAGADVLYDVVVLGIPDGVAVGVEEDGERSSSSVVAAVPEGSAAGTRFVSVLRAALQACGGRPGSLVLLTDSPREAAERGAARGEKVRRTAEEKAGGPQRRRLRQKQERVVVAGGLEAREAAGLLCLPAEVQRAAPYNTRRVFAVEEVRRATGVWYTDEHYARLAAHVLRRACGGLVRGHAKVLCVDGDWTLWAGVVSEAAGPGDVRPVAALQERLRRAREAGRVLCVLSKNDEADVRAVFRENAAMRLREEDVAAFAVNWEPKHENLGRVCAGLNLSAGSCVFLDDSPVEINEMRTHRPEVLSVLVTEANRRSVLARLWAFDVDPRLVTADDAQRTDRYRGNAERQALLEKQQQQAPESAARPCVEVTPEQRLAQYAGFLQQLQLVLEAVEATEDGSVAAAWLSHRGVMTPDERARAAQLTLRTNQYNVHDGLRLQEEGLSRYLAARGEGEGGEVGGGGELRRSCVGVDVRDSYGEYGMVAVALYRVLEAAGGSGGGGGVRLAVDQLCMSCRVVNRGVEHHVLASLAREALEREGGRGGRCTVEVGFRRTAKNAPMLAFLNNARVAVARVAAAAVGGSAAGGDDATAAAAVAAEQLAVGESVVFTYDASALSKLTWRDTYLMASGPSAAATPPPVAAAAASGATREDVVRRLLTVALEEPSESASTTGTAAAAAAAASEPFEAALSRLLARVSSDGDAGAAGAVDVSCAALRARRLSEMGVSSLGVVRLMQGIGEWRTARGGGGGGGCVPAVKADLFLTDPTVGDIVAHFTSAAASTEAAVAAAGAPATAAAAVTQLLAAFVDVARVVLRLPAGARVDPDVPLADLPHFDEILVPEFFAAVQDAADAAAASAAAAAAAAAASSSSAPPPRRSVALPAAWSTPAAAALLTLRAAAEQAATLLRKRAWAEAAPGHASPSDRTAGVYHAKCGDTAALRAQLASDRDKVVRRDKHGLDALAWAAGSGHLAAVRWCVEEAGFEIDSRSRDARTPLMWACRNGHLDVVRYLIAAGADARAVNKKGNTCLHWAIWGGATSVAQLLVDEHGHSVNDTNHSGCCAAVWAATEGSVALCEWVRERGGDFSRLNHWGHGCVVKASWRNNVALLRWLFGVAGVPAQHMFYEDVDGKVPLDLAQSRSHAEAVAFLTEAMERCGGALERRPAPTVSAAAGPIEY